MKDLIIIPALFIFLSLFSPPLVAQTMNSILQYQPQFLFECVDNCEVKRVNNAGIGDGVSTTNAPDAFSTSTFFCNSDDEENAFLGKTGGGTPNGLDSLGSYRFGKMRDKWREQRDGKAIYLGEPLVATNCVRTGQRGVLNFDRWRTSATPTVYGDTPRFRNVVKEHFARRNFLEDGSDFRYGRYLFKFMPADSFDPNAFGRVANPAPDIPANDVYGGFFFEPNYFDCSYGREQQRAGFLCGEMASAQAYAGLDIPSANVSPLLPNAPVHPQQWNFYRDLLKQAVDLMGVRIDQNYWGRVRPRMSFRGSAYEGNEREMAAIVVTIWEILKQMESRIRRNSIEGRCASTPNDAYVALDRGGSRPKVVFRKDLCMDTQARRTVSNPHFNVVADANQPGYSTTAPSYGTLFEGGLYENLFVPNRGYRWVVEGSGEGAQMRAVPIDGRIPSYGHGGLAVSMMAHQLCHLFYREQDISFAFGSPQASGEEELCVMAQALVYQTLVSLGHIRDAGAMHSEECNPDSDPNEANPNEDGFICRRFFYMDDLRALNNIAIAPLHEDMMGIAHNLKRRDHEMARMEAHLVSMCPFLPEPEYASINGVVQSNPYYVAPPAPPLPEPSSPQTDIRVQTPATSPGGQAQQGVQNTTVPGGQPSSGGSVNVNQQSAPKAGSGQPAPDKPAAQGDSKTAPIVSPPSKGKKK